jgi:hypothetical protein
VNGAALLDGLRAHFLRHVVLPKHTDVLLALWTLHTWVFDCFDITPYLAITSPTRRCGKTLLMTMLFWLCCRAKKNDSMSKPAIYRSVDRDKPTLCLDEVGWVVDLRDERQNILCGGFERLGHAEVCEGEGADEMGTTSDFSIRVESDLHGCEKCEKPANDGGLHAYTDKHPPPGEEGHSGEPNSGNGAPRFRSDIEDAYEELALREAAAPGDGLDIPACLDRRGEVCAQCGQLGGIEWDWFGRKVRLHSPHCERLWIDAREASRNGPMAFMGSSA